MFKLPQEVEDRITYLTALYILVNGEGELTAPHRRITELAKLDERRAGKALAYLKINGCLLVSNLNEISITPTGLAAVKDTSYLYWERPVINYFLKFEGKVADTSFHFNTETTLEPQDLETFIAELKEELPHLEIDEVKKQDIELDIEAIEEEMATEEPIMAVIRIALRNIKAILKDFIFHTPVRLLLAKLVKLINEQK